VSFNNPFVSTWDKIYHFLLKFQHYDCSLANYARYSYEQNGTIVRRKEWAVGIYLNFIVYCWFTPSTALWFCKENSPFIIIYIPIDEGINSKQSKMHCNCSLRSNVMVSTSFWGQNVIAISFISQIYYHFMKYIIHTKN